MRRRGGVASIATVLRRGLATVSGGASIATARRCGDAVAMRPVLTCQCDVAELKLYFWPMGAPWPPTTKSLPLKAGCGAVAWRPVATV